MDWKYNWRECLVAFLVLAFAVLSGLALLVDGSSRWATLGGGLLTLAGVSVIGLFVRWLLRPLDPEALQRQRETYEEMRVFPKFRWREDDED